MNMQKCLSCGRIADCFKDECSYCSKLDFFYSQGALTLKKYDELMQEWKVKRELKGVGLK